MKARAQFSKNLSEPLFRQLMAYIEDQIRSGAFSPDKPLPSLNAMAIQTGLSKETVIKAYAHLCKGGAINSLPGKGYFVREGYLSGKPSLFVLMDKLSLHQQDIMGGIMEELSGRADITIRMHYQDIGQFESELGKALDRYDWYLVFPHFSIDKVTQEKAARLLGTIPPEKLIIMDRLIDGVQAQQQAAARAIRIMTVISDLIRLYASCS